MKTEEVLRRAGEYRAVREVLGTYHVDVVAVSSAPARRLGAEGGLGSSETPHMSPADGVLRPDLVATPRDETSGEVGASLAPPGASS
jgi:hypothetical protein